MALRANWSPEIQIKAQERRNAWISQAAPFCKTSFAALSQPFKSCTFGSTPQLIVSNIKTPQNREKSNGSNGPESPTTWLRFFWRSGAKVRDNQVVALHPSTGITHKPEWVLTSVVFFDLTTSFLKSSWGLVPWVCVDVHEFHPNSDSRTLAKKWTVFSSIFWLLWRAWLTVLSFDRKLVCWPPRERKLIIGKGTPYHCELQSASTAPTHNFMPSLFAPTKYRIQQTQCAHRIKMYQISHSSQLFAHIGKHRQNPFASQRRSLHS